MSEREKIIEVMARAQVAYLYPTDEGYPGYDDLAPEAISILHACATAALAALEAAGVRLVPVEATLEMSYAGESKMADKDVALILRRKKGEASKSETVLDSLYAGEIYAAMLAASPYAKENGNG